MKKRFCVMSAALFTVVSMACIVQAEPGDVFQPMLDTDTSCEITVIGSYSNFEALEAEFERLSGSPTFTVDEARAMLKEKYRHAEASG